MQDAIRTMHEYAEEDIDIAIDHLESAYGMHCLLDSMNYDCDMNEDGSIYCDVTATLRCNGIKFDVDWTYVTDADSHETIYVDSDTEELAECAKLRYDEACGSGSPVTSVTSVLAADDSEDTDDPSEDEFKFSDDNEDVEIDDMDVDDQLDSIADDIEDLKDAVDEIQEDDVSIEIDNNIDKHYIAECDKCHGIFISAVVESEQVLDHIHGVCPLCDSETDQYLKWIINEVR